MKPEIIKKLILIDNQIDKIQQQSLDLVKQRNELFKTIFDQEIQESNKQQQIPKFQTADELFTGANKGTFNKLSKNSIGKIISSKPKPKKKKGGVKK